MGRRPVRARDDACGTSGRRGGVEWLAWEAGRLTTVVPRSRWSAAADRPASSGSGTGPFHRAICLLLVGLAALILLVEIARHHQPTELTLLAALLLVAITAGRWLARDLAAHPKIGRASC